MIYHNPSPSLGYFVTIAGIMLIHFLFPSMSRLEVFECEIRECIKGKTKLDITRYNIARANEFISIFQGQCFHQDVTGIPQR